MSPYVGLSFDVLILIALGATIFHCLRLSRQFNEMHANRKAFDALIASLNVASSRAEMVIKSLKDAAMDSGDMIQEKIGRARALNDELEIMIQAGDTLANRLQGLAEKSRKVNPAETIVDDSPATPELQPRTKAEKELLEAIKAKQQT